MTRTITFTGWAQSAEALDRVAPGATHFDYLSYSDVENAFRELRTYGEFDHAIGWSLGGLVAAQAIESGILKAEALTIIGTPFQFLQDHRFGAGMPRETFDAFMKDFKANPQDTLKKFAAMFGYGDSNAKEVVKKSNNTKSTDHLSYWLEYIANYSCFDMDFSSFPHTLLVYGDSDIIVPTANGHKFKDHIANSHLEIIPECGHAPHLHNQEQLSNLIQEFMKSVSG